MITAQNQKWWTVVAMAIPLFIVTLDFFGIAVALPSIGRDLRTSTAALEWTVNAFMLGFAAPLIAVGRLGDLVGRRKVLLFGTVLFAIASALGGVAQTDAWLITARAVQGLGAAMSFANSLSIVTNAFPDEQRALGIGVWSSIGTIGSAVGPLIGGVLTELVSWRWFFFVNIPIAVAAIALTLIAVRESRDDTARGGIDWTGFTLVTASFVLLVLGIELIDRFGWRSSIVAGTLLVGVLLLAGFVLLEQRVANPLVELDLFMSRNFLTASGVAFFANFVFGALTFFMTLYLQHVLDFSPVAAGLGFLAYTVPFIPMSTLAGRAMGPWGARKCMTVGMAILAASFAILACISRSTGVLLALSGLAVHSVGQAYAYNISTAAAMAAVPGSKAGAASGVISSIRMMAVVFGVAATGAVFKALEHTRMVELVARAGRQLSEADRDEVRALVSGSDAAQVKLATLVPEVARRVEAIVNEAFVHALDCTMLLCLALALAGMVSALLARAERRPSVAPAPAGAQATAAKTTTPSGAAGAVSSEQGQLNG